MVLDRLFLDKYDWQKDAFNRIKSQLLPVRDNPFVQYNYTAATHLVCVYGKPQVGKTTLILNMIGLKDDDSKRDVSEVLRGGIAHGNSSTSTAIIYSQSESDDLYGVRIETLEGKELSVVEYCTSDGMLQKLQSIRNDVEKNLFSNKAILHISIPKKYFSSSDTDNKISILDLPGVESRNILERAHVESLMNRYIPLSSVCIIACTSNEIKSLKKLELPNNIDWKNLPHRFFVVITRSYSAGSIKEYFKSPRNQRKTRFKDFLLNQYKEDLSKILGKDFMTKIFLLDMGDSFVSLCKELINEEDRGEVTETRDFYLSSLRESISSSKGYNLQSCIKELRAIVNKIEESKIIQLKEIAKKKEEEKNEIFKRKEKLESNRNNNKFKIQEFESSIEKLNNLNKTVENELLKAATSFSDNLIVIIKKEIVEKSLFKDKNGIRYFYDKNRVCMKGIQNHLMILGETIRSQVPLLLKGSEFNIDFYPSSIANSIYSQFAKMYEKELYPPSSFIKNLFGNSPKVDISSAYSYIQQIKTIIQSEIRSSVIVECQTKIRKKRDDYLVDSKWRKSKLKEEENEIKSKEEELKRIKNEIDENNEELLAVGNQKRQDEQTLDEYLKHAKETYLSQRNEIFESINSKKTSPPDKFLYIILLGIIDKDYKNITNESNE